MEFQVLFNNSKISYFFAVLNLRGDENVKKPKLGQLVLFRFIIFLDR